MIRFRFTKVIVCLLAGAALFCVASNWAVAQDPMAHDIRVDVYLDTSGPSGVAGDVTITLLAQLGLESAPAFTGYDLYSQNGIFYHGGQLFSTPYPNPDAPPPFLNAYGMNAHDYLISGNLTWSLLDDGSGKVVGGVVVTPPGTHIAEGMNAGGDPMTNDINWDTFEPIDTTLDMGNIVDPALGLAHPDDILFSWLDNVSPTPHYASLSDVVWHTEAPVPEPSTLVLLGGALVVGGVGFVRRRNAAK